MLLDIKSTDSQSAGQIEVSEVVFAKEFNEPLVHQVVVAKMAAQRSGTKAQKSRSDVSGGGKKPWRQKGTGRARAGTIRSPLWRSGGVTFAAEPRDHTKKVNKKMYAGALRSVLSELLRQERLQVVENFVVSTPKTKEFVEITKSLSLNLKKLLVITAEFDESLYLSSRNIPDVSAVSVDAVDPLLLIKSETVVITKDALKKIEERLS